MHSTAGKKLSFSFEGFLLIEIPQKRTFSLPVKTCEENVPEHSESLLLRPGGQERKTLATRAKVYASRVFCAVKKHFSLKEGLVPFARTAERTFPPPIPTNPRRIGQCASIRPSRFDLGLALITPSPKKRRPSHLHEGEKVMNPFLRS